MIQDMLFLAQVDNAQAALHPEQVNLAAECAKLIEYFEPLIEEGRLRVDLNGQGSVQADSLLVQRAFGIESAVGVILVEHHLVVGMAIGLDEALPH